MKLQYQENSLGFQLGSSNAYPLGSGEWKLLNLRIFQTLFGDDHLYSGHTAIFCGALDILEEIYEKIGFVECEQTPDQAETNVYQLELKEGVKQLDTTALENFRPVRIIVRNGDRIIQQSIGGTNFISPIGFENKHNAEIAFRAKEGWDVIMAYNLIKVQAKAQVKSVEVNDEVFEYLVVDDHEFAIDLQSAFFMAPSAPEMAKPVQIVSHYTGYTIKGDDSTLKEALIKALGWETLSFNCEEAIPTIINFFVEFLTDSGFEVEKTSDNLHLIVKSFQSNHLLSEKVFELVAIFKQNPSYTTTIEARSIKIGKGSQQLTPFGIGDTDYSAIQQFEHKAFTYDQMVFAQDLANQAGSTLIDSGSFIQVPITKQFNLELSKFTMLPQELTLRFETVNEGQFGVYCDGMLDQTQVKMNAELQATEGLKVYGAGTRSASYTIDQDVYPVVETYLTVFKEIIEAGWKPVKTYNSTGTAYHIDFRLVDIQEEVDLEVVASELQEFFEVESEDSDGFWFLGSILGNLLAPFAVVEQPEVLEETTILLDDPDVIDAIAVIVED